MATKFTAAQLRGLKAEKEKELYNSCITGITTSISHRIVEVAEKGETKLIVYVDNSNGMISCRFNPNGSVGMPYNKELSEDLIASCCSKLQEQYVDCSIEAEMEEVPADRYNRKPRTRFTITIDWSDAKPEAAVPEVSELEKLKARVAELEAENSRLKSNPIGAVTQMTTDLLDIFAGFGKIVESKTE